MRSGWQSTLTLLAVIGFLAACNAKIAPRLETPELSTSAPATATTLEAYPAVPAPIATLPAYPVITSTFTSPGQTQPTLTNTPSPTPLPSPTPGKQVYEDPNGRYRVELPDNWTPGDPPGTFSGPDGYFQAGDLPEMGFYSRAFQVCMRLVQRLQEPAVSLMLPLSGQLSGKVDSCQVAPIPYQNPVWAQAVIKVPGVSPDLRYTYFKADGDHLAAIAASLEMLVPVSQEDFYAFPSGPLRPADQAFWDTPRVLSAGITLTETRLEVPTGESPEKSSQFARYVPRDLWIAGFLPTPLATSDPLIEANQVLTRFGYELRKASADVYRRYDLYQDGKRIREQINIEQTPTLSASGRDFALPFYSTNGPEILRSSGIEKWKMEFGSPYSAYRFLGEDLLVPVWNLGYSSIDVIKENEVFYRFNTFFGSDFGFKTFQVWQNHWLLEVRGFLIQDGVILNDQLSYEEIFDWQLLNGKPFYFFRKGPRVGISYDGQVLPVYYDEVAHYLCCGTGVNNPISQGDMIQFFALRDGVWYFIRMST